MTVKVGYKEFNLDGYANTDELQRLLIECYQQGRADAINKVIKYVKKMYGYTDWADGGCTYDELIDRDYLLKWLKEQSNGMV